jgi:hypothetical protein
LRRAKLPAMPFSPEKMSHFPCRLDYFRIVGYFDKHRPLNPMADNAAVLAPVERHPRL